MPDKAGRSVFVPLLIGVVVIVGLGLFGMLAPIVECGHCERTKLENYINSHSSSDEHVPSICVGCGGEGKVPLLDLWRREAE